MNDMKSGTTQKVWLLAAISGLVSFLGLLILAGYSTGSSVIVGCLVTVLVAILLWIAWYKDEIHDEAADAPVVAGSQEQSLDADAEIRSVEPDAAPNLPVEVLTAEPKVKRALVARDGKPELLQAARSEGADDLKRLKGVGPKLEGRLNVLGFYHFDQIAGLRKKEVLWVDKTLDAKGRIERDGWVAQAKILAKGGDTEFSKRAKKDGAH